MTDQTKKSSPALVFLAWLVVSIPAGWGVYNTVLGAVRLFTDTPTTLMGAPIVTPPK
jgi:hypothetical protein